jgi:hypothetical protein
LIGFLLVFVSLFNRLVFDKAWLIVRVSVAQRCNILLCRFFFWQTKDKTVKQRDRPRHQREDNPTAKGRTVKDAQTGPKTSKVLLGQPLQMFAGMLSTYD